MMSVLHKSKDVEKGGMNEKINFIGCCGAITAAVLLSGCSKKDDSVLSVGATPEPHAEMLKLVVQI